jgi:hypothetical protein
MTRLILGEKCGMPGKGPPAAMGVCNVPGAVSAALTLASLSSSEPSAIAPKLIPELRKKSRRLTVWAIFRGFMANSSFECDGLVKVKYNAGHRRVCGQERGVDFRVWWALAVPDQLQCCFLVSFKILAVTVEPTP